jgi:hypothetical protein
MSNELAIAQMAITKIDDPDVRKALNEICFAITKIQNENDHQIALLKIDITSVKSRIH